MHLWQLFFSIFATSYITVGCKYYSSNIFTAKKCKAHESPISFLNMATCTLSLQWTWWPKTCTSLVIGSYYCETNWTFVHECQSHSCAEHKLGQRCTFRRLKTFRPKQNHHHSADDIFKWIFLNENVWIAIKISPKFVPKCQINNIPSLVQIMAWHRPGDKPLKEPMMVSLLTHICVTRSQWVNNSLR